MIGGYLYIIYQPQVPLRLPCYNLASGVLSYSMCFCKYSIYDCLIIISYKLIVIVNNSKPQNFKTLVHNLINDRHLIDGQYLPNVKVHRCVLINDYSEFLIHVVEFQTTILISPYFTGQLHLTVLHQFVRFKQHVCSPYSIRVMKACHIPNKRTSY